MPFSKESLHGIFSFFWRATFSRLSVDNVAAWNRCFRWFPTWKFQVTISAKRLHDLNFGNPGFNSAVTETKLFKPVQVCHFLDKIKLRKNLTFQRSVSEFSETRNKKLEIAPNFRPSLPSFSETVAQISPEGLSKTETFLIRIHSEFSNESSRSENLDVSRSLSGFLD